MSKFNLSQYDPTGKVWFALPLAGDPELLLSHAGRSNVQYTQAVAKHSAQSQAARRASSGTFSAKMLDEMTDLERELFAKYVVCDWRGVVDVDGNVVEFSRESCAEFMEALPTWIIQEISNFAATPTNFTSESLPSDEEVRHQAGE